MIQRLTLITVLCFWVVFLSATGCKHDHHHDDHEIKHGHGGHESESEGLEAISVTIWAAKTELFMEYEPLVTGKPSRFAAHLTTLHDFKAVTTGVLKLSIKCDNDNAINVRAQKPSNPGIFRFTVEPQKAGKCKMNLKYNGQGLQDEINAGVAIIHKDLKAARAVSSSDEAADGIAYTKEQQWRTDFAMVEVEEMELQSSVGAVGQIEPALGNKINITAPARGRLAFASTIALPGMVIKKGQLLATVSPYLDAGGDRSSLDAETHSARAEYSAAQSQLERLERLFKEKAIPEKRIVEARARVSITKAKLDAADGRLKQYSQNAAGMATKGPGAFRLRSAIEGTLVEVNATRGESVEEGKLLFVIIDVSKVWLVTRIFETDIPKVESASSAWFTLEGYKEPFIINELNGRVVTLGSVIDPKNRTVPVIFEMENPGGNIRIGQFAQVNIATGQVRKTLALPTEALLDDGGKKIVFVQVGGETFERRVVRTGISSKGFVEIVSGLKIGEKVVTTGAYEVHLTAASGVIPEHGHVH